MHDVISTAGFKVTLQSRHACNSLIFRHSFHIVIAIAVFAVAADTSVVTDAAASALAHTVTELSALVTAAATVLATVAAAATAVVTDTTVTNVVTFAVIIILDRMLLLLP
jgi:hypothetical protein